MLNVDVYIFYFQMDAEHFENMFAIHLKTKPKHHKLCHINMYIHSAYSFR